MLNRDKVGIYIIVNHDIANLPNSGRSVMSQTNSTNYLLWQWFFKMIYCYIFPLLILNCNQIVFRLCNLVPFILLSVDTGWSSPTLSDILLTSLIIISQCNSALLCLGFVFIQIDFRDRNNRNFEERLGSSKYDLTESKTPILSLACHFVSLFLSPRMICIISSSPWGCYKSKFTLIAYLRYAFLKIIYVMV